MARQIVVELVGDASKLSGAFKQVEDKSQGLGDKLQSVGKTLTTHLTLPLAGLAAVGVAKLGETQKQFAQTEAAIKSTGGAAGVTAKHIGDMADSLANLSGLDDDAIQSGENLLLTFTDIRNEAGKGNDIFDQATKTLADMSVALGQDTKSSAIQLGKALNDPIQGVTALRRVGVSFSEDQQKLIKHLVETGDTLGAQKLILAELNKEFGGSAEAAGKTLPGQLSILKQQFQEVSANIVEKLLPVMTGLIDKLSGLFDWFGHLTAGQQQFIAVAGLVLAALGPVVGIIGTMINVVKGLGAALQFASANPIVLIIAGIAALAAGLVLAYQHSDTFRKIVNDTFHALGDVVTTVWNIVRPVLEAFKRALEDVAGPLGSVLGAAGKVGGAVGGLLGHLPHFAAGGSINGLGVVGENGPELFVGRGTIVPNGALGGPTVVQLVLDGRVITEVVHDGLIAKQRTGPLGIAS